MTIWPSGDKEIVNNNSVYKKPQNRVDSSNVLALNKLQILAKYYTVWNRDHEAFTDI